MAVRRMVRDIPVMKDPIPPPPEITLLPEKVGFFQNCSSSGDLSQPDDNFYASWDRFLAKSKNRTLTPSGLVKRVVKTEQDANKDENGLHTKSRSEKSYDDAKVECKARVRSIVEECRRLNQKYVDRDFDLMCNMRDCIQPLDSSIYEDSEGWPSAVKRVEVSRKA